MSPPAIFPDSLSRQPANRGNFGTEGQGYQSVLLCLLGEVLKDLDAPSMDEPAPGFHFPFFSSFSYRKAWATATRCALRAAHSTQQLLGVVLRYPVTLRSSTILPSAF